MLRHAPNCASPSGKDCSVSGQLRSAFPRKIECDLLKRTLSGAEEDRVAEFCGALLQNGARGRKDCHSPRQARMG